MRIVYHLLQLFGYSLLSGILIWPVTYLDTYFFATFNRFPLYFTIPAILVFEAITAIVVYYAALGLSKLIIRDDKKKAKLAE